MPAPERPHPALPVLLAWVLPGAGHLLLRRVWPAVFVAVAVLGLYGGGLVLARYGNVSPERHPYYFAIHAFAAGPTAAATLLTEDVVVDSYPPHRSVGELYTAVACLLNLIAVADVWARCRRGDPETAGEPRRTPVRVEDLVAAEEPPPPAEGRAGG